MVIFVFSTKFGMGNRLIPSENMIVMILLGGLHIDLLYKWQITKTSFAYMSNFNRKRGQQIMISTMFYGCRPLTICINHRKKHLPILYGYLLTFRHSLLGIQLNACITNDDNEITTLISMTG